MNTTAAGEIILDIRHLSTVFETDEGRLPAVTDVSFSLGKGRTLGLVGESGCGKTVTALSIMRLLPQPAGQIVAGRILFDQMDLVRLPADRMRRVRGGRIAMIFQEPMTALNPVQPIGRQLREMFLLHAGGLSPAAMRRRCIDLLQRVGIPEAQRRLEDYPHQISGGMRQRVMIAMALAVAPEILIADEPTTALDVTVQAQILALIDDLQQAEGMSMIFITHDLGVIAEICDDVVVMYAGQVVEMASVTRLFRAPRHPYTQGLLVSIPRLEHPAKSRLETIPGMVPGLAEMPAGCRFINRCPHAFLDCKTPPPLVDLGDGHFARCFLYSSGRESGA